MQNLSIGNGWPIEWVNSCPINNRLNVIGTGDGPLRSARAYWACHMIFQRPPNTGERNLGSKPPTYFPMDAKWLPHQGSSTLSSRCIAAASLHAKTKWHSNLPHCIAKEAESLNNQRRIKTKASCSLKRLFTLPTFNGIAKSSRPATVAAGRLSGSKAAIKPKLPRRAGSKRTNSDWLAGGEPLRAALNLSAQDRMRRHAASPSSMGQVAPKRMRPAIYRNGTARMG